MELSLPAGWQWRKARDCMDVRDGTHDSPKYIPLGYPLVTSKNLVNGKIDFSTCSFISKEDFDAISKRSAVDDGDILYAMIGTIGNPVIVQKQSEFAIKNVALFKFNNGNILNKYVYHFLNSEFAVSQFNSNSRGGTQKFVSLTNIRDLRIPLPPLAEQQKIAAILDAADRLRQKDHQLVERYTTLSQSLFLEMFGDPLKNPQKWKLTALSSLVKAVIDCPHTTPRWTEFGKVAIRTSNLTEGGWIWGDKRYVSEQEFHERSARAYVKSGDIVLSREGTVGVAAIVSPDMEICLGQRLVQIQPNLQLANNHFLLNLILYELAPERIETVMVGATSKHLNLKDLRSMKMITPPISLQNQFAERIKLIEAQKQKAQTSLQKSEALFNSLLQQAFTGELTRAPMERAA